MRQRLVQLCCRKSIMISPVSGGIHYGIIGTQGLQAFGTHILMYPPRNPQSIHSLLFKAIAQNGRLILHETIVKYDIMAH